MPDQENRLFFGSQLIEGAFWASKEAIVRVPETTNEKAPLEFVLTEIPSELTLTESMAALDTESVTTPFMLSLTCAEMTETKKEQTKQKRANRVLGIFLLKKAIKVTPLCREQLSHYR
jgi:hypothetical protein